MKRKFSPILTIGLSVALLALFFQWFGISYLNNLSSTQLKSDADQFKLQISKDIAAQLSRALAIQDDLGALAAIKATRINHPQLQSLMIFDNQGRISLHTDPGMMGKKVAVPVGPRLVKPSLKPATINNRQMTIILLPLPDNDNYYCQAFFDDHRSIKSSKIYFVRFLIIIFLISIALGLFTLLFLKRFDLINPKEIAYTNPTTDSNLIALQTLTDNIINKSVVMIIDNQNKILGINTSIISVKDNVVGKHIMRSGLSKEIINTISQLSKNPNSMLSIPISTSKTVNFGCIPANQEWQYMVLWQ